MPDIQLVPTVLAENETEFVRQIGMLSPLSDRIQIDIADGLLVENTTVGTEFVIRHLAENCQNYEGKLFDFHLMVKYWEAEADILEKAQESINVNLVLPHYSVYRQKEASFNIGVVFNPEEDIDKSLLEGVPAIQIMTVTPGRQGNTFLRENLHKIKLLRSYGYRREILVDGGINEKTLPLILAEEDRPDVLGIGSYLTKAERPDRNYRLLLDLIKA